MELHYKNLKIEILNMLYTNFYEDGFKVGEGTYKINDSICYVQNNLTKHKEEFKSLLFSHLFKLKPKKIVYDGLDYYQNAFKSTLEDYYLDKINPRYLNQIKKYREEFIEVGSSLDGTSGLSDYENMDEWYQHTKDLTNVETLPEGYALGFLYVFVDSAKDEVVGCIDIRPDIKNHYILNEFAGNIGYSIRPSRRKEGLGSLMLKKCLPICKEEYGLDKVLVTCDEENEGSRKIILNNGGIFERDTFNVMDNQILKRYYIEIKE